MKSVTLQIAMNPPWVSEEDSLFPWPGNDFGVPGLAVSPTPRKVGDGQLLERKYRSWVIVHLPSGRRIGPKFPSRAAAAAVGLQLGELLSDWNFSAEEIRNNPDLVRAGKYIVYGGG